MQKMQKILELLPYYFVELHFLFVKELFYYDKRTKNVYNSSTSYIRWDW